MVSEFERACKYNDMQFEIENTIVDYCAGKYSPEYADHTI